MHVRTRLDPFSAALLSALGATQLVACGGSAVVSGGNRSGAGGDGSGSAGASGAVIAGASTGGAGSEQGGADNGQSGAAAAGALGGAGAPANRSCTNPQDLANGFVKCDGFVHRQEIGTCASHVPRPGSREGMFTLKDCRSDVDCDAHPYGWCTAGQDGQTYCEYGCVSDGDCAEHQLCDCAEPVGRCVAANCTSDADCASGFLCRAYDASSGCGPIVYTCQSPADSCGNDADCMQGPSSQARFGKCNFDSTAQSFQCNSLGCVIGRPFLVEGAQRLASVTARADWLELARLPQLTDLDATLRAQLAEQWTRMALMEHASIAAFARFALQLTSLGAPAELLERATAAMRDETKHAKACFAVASGYAGAPLGPGRLVIERSLDESSLQEIVLNAIREGCVGETVAAIEAREAAEHASEPAVAELLLRISEDETRHAELAYRFVKWALALGGAELERAVQREFEALAAQAPPVHDALTDGDRDLLRHGILPEGMRSVIREQALAEVILPCSRALFRAQARRWQYANSNV